MDVISDTKNKNIDDERGKTGYHSYILRIWKTDEGAFKGYVLDPLTNKTYPVVSVPREKALEPSIPGGIKGVWIEPMGCWLGVWESVEEDEELE